MVRPLFLLQYQEVRKTMRAIVRKMMRRMMRAATRSKYTCIIGPTKTS
jgi:hypothetical protein